MGQLKLGKTPARKDAITFKLADFVDKSVVWPKIPKTFGHEGFISKKAWGMLGNDEVGDCVLAGGGHETMLWNAIAGNTVQFSTANTLKDYSAITGYDPKDPSTDQGTDMQVAASYRRKTGLLDASGKRHKVAAYLSIKPGDVQEHLIALYLFGAVGIGIEFPGSAMDQFNAGRNWSVVKGSSIEGGHYIPLVAKRTSIEAVTWGSIVGMTQAFFEKYNDESVAYVSLEMMKNGVSAEGFDAAKLTAFLNALPKA